MVLRDSAFVRAYRVSVLVAGGQGILAVVAVLPDVQSSSTQLDGVVSGYDPNNPSTNANVNDTVFEMEGFVSYDNSTVVISDVPESPGSNLVPADPLTYWAPYRRSEISMRFRFANPSGYTGTTIMRVGLNGVADNGNANYTVVLRKYHDTGEFGVELNTFGNNANLTRYPGTPGDVYWIYFSGGMLRIDRIYPTAQNFYIRKFSPFNTATPTGRIIFNGPSESPPRRIGQGWEHILFTYGGVAI